VTRTRFLAFATTDLVPLLRQVRNVLEHSGIIATDVVELAD
jgi:hypothetical protein